MLLKPYILLIFLVCFSCNNQTGNYICPPCNMDCDSLSFSESGICEHCQMELIKKNEKEFVEDLNVNKLEIKEGSGSFLIEGGYDKSKTILVHYHKPLNLTAKSKVIMVIPGAGRNGDDYRDAWIEESEKYGLLVLSPEYSEQHYPEFWSYNLGGMITDVIVNKDRTEVLDYKIINNPQKWIWQDFDRIFDAVSDQLNLKTSSYDMFGHSAGGQILHRLTLFHPENKADRILASNSGWYTIPSESNKFPFGRTGINLHNNQIKDAYAKKLIIFLGEMDNENETRGHLVHTPQTDTQGTHRLARGKYFFQKSSSYAKNIGADFNWKLEVIPDIGHDYKKMSQQAAQYLYQSQTKN